MADGVADSGAAPVPPPADPPAPGHVCRNCGAHATGHYCTNCGQETRVALPTFGTFMREAAGRYVALDGRLWRTLFALIARPGHLTLEYFAGRRRRYIRPARLFLVLYLLLFAVIGLLQSPSELASEVVFVDPDKTDAAQAAQDVTASKGNALRDTAAQDAAKAEAREALKQAAKQTKEATKGLVVFEDKDEEAFFGLDKDLNFNLQWGGADVPMPPQLRKRIERFKNLSRDEKAEQLYAGVLRYGPYAMVVLLPAFALLLKLAYLGRGRRYPGRPTRYAEHLVYSAHLHAFAALAILAMLSLPSGPVRYPMLAWILFYVMRARQVVYRGRWWGGLLRAFVIATVYLVLMSLAIAGLLAMAVMLR